MEGGEAGMLGQAHGAQATGGGTRSDRQQRADRKGSGGAASATPNPACPGEIVVTTANSVMAGIVTCPWPRTGVTVRKLRGGYTLSSARTGARVARLKSM